MLGTYLIDLQYHTPKQTYIVLDEFVEGRFWGKQIFSEKIWGTCDFEETAYLFTISKEGLQDMINSGAAVKLL